MCRWMTEGTSVAIHRRCCDYNNNVGEGNHQTLRDTTCLQIWIEWLYRRCGRGQHVRTTGECVKESVLDASVTILHRNQQARALPAIRIDDKHYTTEPTELTTYIHQGVKFSSKLLRFGYMLGGWDRNQCRMPRGHLPPLPSRGCRSPPHTLVHSTKRGDRSASMRIDGLFRKCQVLLSSSDHDQLIRFGTMI